MKGFLKLMNVFRTMKVHERKINDFYSAGLDEKKDSEYDESKEKMTGKFLNFGYWEKETDDYLDAARRLLNFFIENSGVKKAKKVLNVCCGYGTETFTYFKKFKPIMIKGLDITKLQVDYANDKAKKLKVDDKIKFKHGDACVLNFPEKYFSHVLGIEGIANFNTREKFFKAVSRVLQKDGELILTDIILGKKFNNKSRIHKFLVSLVCKGWVVPRANWVNEENYKKQLEKHKLKVIFIKKIGNKVFPGYGNYFSKFDTIKKLRKERGIFNSLGLSIISMMLGYLYQKGWIEYIYVKAKKS